MPSPGTAPPVTSPILQLTNGTLPSNAATGKIAEPQHHLRAVGHRLRAEHRGLQRVGALRLRAGIEPAIERIADEPGAQRPGRTAASVFPRHLAVERNLVDPPRRLSGLAGKPNDTANDALPLEKYGPKIRPAVPIRARPSADSGMILPYSAL